MKSRNHLRIQDKIKTNQSLSSHFLSLQFLYADFFFFLFFSSFFHSVHNFLILSFKDYLAFRPNPDSRHYKIISKA